MKPVRTIRRKAPVSTCRLLLEQLEDRCLLSAFTDLAGVVSGVTTVQTSLDTVLNTASKIPLLTQNGSGVLGSIKEAQIVTSDVVTKIQTALNDVSNNTDTKMTTALETAFGVSPGDVKLTDPGDGSVAIEVHLHQTLAAATLPANFNLNLGLSGLPVNIGASTTGSLNAQVGYDFAFGFGIHIDKSLFVDPNAKLSDFGSTLPAHQLALQAIVAPSANFQATATVGLLEAIISENKANSSKLTASFNIDNLSLSGAPTVALSGSVNLNLHAAASFAATTDSGNSGATFKFPGIGTDLIVNWALPNGTPDVSYTNVSFELGSFLSSFVGPIIKDIQIFTEPIQPIIDVLTLPLPALSDLSHVIGQGDITILGVAKVAAALGLFGPGIDEAVQLIATLAKITDDINAIDVGPNDVSVPLGSFSLDSSDDTTSLLNDVAGTPGTTVGDLAPNLLLPGGIQGLGHVISGIEDAANSIPGLGDVAKGALKKLGDTLDNGFKLNFPIIDDPAGVIFPMLLGHDGELASFDADFSFNADLGKIPTGFSMFGIGIDATGTIGVEAHLHLGYDTFGLRQFFTDVAKGNPVVGALPDLLNGFYVTDATPQKPQFEISGAFQLAASIGDGFFSVGVGGGAFTGGSLSDPDPIIIGFHDLHAATDDNKLRLSNIGEDMGRIFDVVGKLSAAVGIEVKVGYDSPFGFIGFSHTFDIASVNILDLSSIDPVTVNGQVIGHLGRNGIPSQNPPILAGVDGSGNMTLGLGANVSQRQNVPDTTDDNPENWEVSHEDGDPADTLTVKAFGLSQKVPGVKKIIAVGGSARQTITIDEGVAADANLQGGVLDDQLTYLGSGHAILSGEDGNDRLTVGPQSGDSELHGGKGDDILIGGGGNDKLYGDEGNDHLFAGTGNQLLDGGVGDDQLTAGKGNDSLYGGDGNDLISWKVGDGAPVVVDAGSADYTPNADGSIPIGNTLEVLGDNNSDSFAASANGGALAVVATGVPITASNIQRLSLDGQGGADVITVHSLAGTSVTEVHVNQSQAIAPDGAADVVNVDTGPSTDMLIDEAVGDVVAAVPANGSDPAKPAVQGAQALINFHNGLTYKVFVANPEVGDSLNLNSVAGSTITIDMLKVDSAVSGTPLPASLALPGQLVINDNPGNIFNVRSTSGPTTINAHGGINTFNVGSLAPAANGTLAGIQGALTLNGSGGADVANIDDSGDATGQSGTLTATSLTGLGMGGAITYGGLNSLAVNLGLGNDTFTVAATHGTTTSVDAGPGADTVSLQALDGPTTVHGGAGNDSITLSPTVVVGPTQLFGDQGDDTLTVDRLPARQVSGTVSLDGGDGSDAYNVNIAGDGNYLINVHDTGTTGSDTLTVNGTAQADNFLLRASGYAYPTGVAFVAALHGAPVSDVERVNYDKSLEALVVNAGAGDDTVTLDDNWAPTTISGGDGADHIQIGQIFKSERDAANASIAANDEFKTTHTTRGYLSNGVSYPTTINGDAGNDDFVVFRNTATLALNGGEGDDTFTVRAFALEGSMTSTVSGQGGADRVEYVVNAAIAIDGGDGFDTIRIIGTEFSDTFVITKNGITGAGINITYTNIEALEIDGAEGNDTFYVLSTDPNVKTTLFGGLGSDRFFIGADVPVIKDGSGTVLFPATVGPHTLGEIGSQLLTIDGAAGKGSAGGLGTPVMLPGETNVLPSVGAVLAYTGTGAGGTNDTMTIAGAQLGVDTGNYLVSIIANPLTQLVGQTLEISAGPGLRRFWLITAVSQVGSTNNYTLTLQNPAQPADEWTLPDSTSSFAITHLSTNFFVDEKTQVDQVGVYDDGATAGQTGTLTSSTLTGLGMGAAGIAYANMETLEVFTGSGSDSVTVSSTMTRADGYQTVTMLNTGAGNDTVNVTLSAATDGFFALNTEAGDDQILASSSTLPLVLFGGTGNDLIQGGQGNDIIFGDTGRVDYRNAAGKLVTRLGLGLAERHQLGAGESETSTSDLPFQQTDGTVYPPTLIVSRLTTTTETGNDTISGNGGSDSILGGAGNDLIYGDGATPTAGDAADIIIGDQGQIQLSAGVVTTITNASATMGADAANGGNDTVYGGAGNDIILGGVGNDSISGNDGNDAIVGDNGLVSLTMGVITSIQNTDPALGGNDTISGNGGADMILGGAGNDLIYGDGATAGATDAGNFVIGDNGLIQLSAGVVTTITNASATITTDLAASGGNDTVYGGAGNDIILGGVGNDTISGNDGNDAIVGDNGVISLTSAGVITSIQNTDPTLGGDDTLSGNGGADVILGGSGSDNISGGDGNDILLGDNGLVSYVTIVGDLSLPDLIQSTYLGVGAADTVYGNAGNDIIIGGAGNDRLYGGNGTSNTPVVSSDNDIILGDNAELDQVVSRAPQRMATIKTTDISNSTGGDDVIEGNEGDDILIGGVGNDKIDGNQGQDLLLGDNGVLTSRTLGVTTDPRTRVLAGTQIYDSNGNAQVTTAWQTAPGAGPAWANYLITLDDGSTGLFGNDYLAGGAGNDMVFGQAGDDTIQGDGSTLLDVGTRAAVKTSVEDFDHIDATTGLPVSVPGNDGNDYIEGGTGNDLIFGGLGQDDLIGGSSNLFGLVSPSQRGDGSDTIFGGAGTRVARNDLGDLSANGHARDADVILGDNGNIFRLIGINGVSGGAYLTFNYDNYGALKIIPRPVQLLDYTPGGSPTDLGGADLIHGEAGDDFIHGETGNDVLAGDGQDDQIIGGTGNDRIYGGAGEDSILGDDGRFVLSRNGLTEPLYGVIAVNVQVDLTLPGPFTGAWIYITGRMNSEAHLLVPTLGGNDLIYGGLGDDFIHGGAGDDAISGGEAQAAWYNDLPVGAGFYSAGGYTVNKNGVAVDPNNPLGYDPTTRKLAAYDANNPLQKIPNFFLNFDATDGAGNKIDDGKDRLFGDDGNDWAVGGTGNNRLFGGKGDDLLNADNNLDTNGGLNNVPDAPLFADRDFVYGGDGLDVMIANTGGDRMYDWGGEFNTYLVPFSPFGAPTVNRAPSPAIQAFLLALGQESGADLTMSEPNGELGLFTQKDPQWGANHGAPRDPQPGNIGGTGRDTQGAPEDDRGTALPLAAVTAAAPASVANNAVDVTLSQVYVATDPSNPVALALFVGGTNGNDTILVRQGTTAAFLDVVINGVDQGQFSLANNGATINRIIIYGNAGDDTITVSPNVTFNTYIDGGAGNDSITGGGGNNFIDGGAGNDVLNGGTGRNILIGGLGQDTLNGGKDDDLLVGGTYKYSGDLDAAFAALAVWTSTGSYAQRLTNLRTGGMDALFAFTALTVLDDSTVDYLYGNQGQDWFWALANDKTDQKGNETNA
jgi:Ca2+-binding RTX toxin-like protein